MANPEGDLAYMFNSDWPVKELAASILVTSNRLSSSLYWGTPPMGTHLEYSGAFSNRNVNCLTSLPCEDVIRTSDAPS